jgi:Fur family ferric uptake transcriptional regulator
MDSTSNHAEKMQILFSNYLKNKKLKNTAERTAICSTVCRINKPFSLDMIRQQLEDINFRVSRASIYNTMELLLDANIVVRHQFNGTTVQYELKHSDEQNIHAICTHCGTVRKVKNEKLDNQFTDFKIPKFSLEHYALQFYGTCSKCKFRLQKETKINKKLKNKVEQ